MKFIYSSILLFLVSCTTIKPYVVEDIQPKKIEHDAVIHRSPILNEVNTIEIGGKPITTTKMVEIKNSIYLRKDDIQFKKRLDRKSLKITMDSGVYFEKYNSPSGTYYIKDKIYICLISPQCKSNQKVVGGIFITNSGQKKSPFFISSDTFEFARFNTIQNDHDILVREDIIPDSYKYELTYMGKSRSTIFIEYREFYDDFVRPAFTRELRYDLDESRIIGYKGARFEVLDATNTKIKYKVLKYL